MVGAAQKLSPNKPIELSYEISKIDYRLGIMTRAGYDKHRKEMRFRGRGTPPYLPRFDPFNHPLYMDN